MHDMSKIEIEMCIGGCAMKCLSPPTFGIFLACFSLGVTLLNRYLIQPRRELEEISAADARLRIQQERLAPQHAQQTTSGIELVSIVDVSGTPPQ